MAIATRALLQVIDEAGRPVVAGFIYYGEYGKDPKLNPIEIYADEELSAPLDNPLRTDIFGRPSAAPHVGVDYSYVITDIFGTTIEGPYNQRIGANALGLTSTALTFECLEDAKSLKPLGSGVLTASLLVGSTISTQSYHRDEAIGGAPYLLTTLAAERARRASPTWVPDGGGDHYIYGSSTVVLVLKHGPTLDVTQFGAIPDYFLPDGTINPTPTDNAPAIQAALDYKPYSTAFLPRRFDRELTGYEIRSPVYEDYAGQLVGADDNTIYLVKTTNTPGIGSTLHNDGTTISYAVDAAIIKRAPNNSSSLGQSVRNLRIRSTVNGAYGIFAAFMSKANDENLTIEGFKRGYYAYDQFLCTLTNVWVRNDGFTRGEYGFEWNKGTSLKMVNCWAKFVQRGVEAGQLHYSMLTCACDNFTHFAYNGGASVTWLACGSEEAHLVEGGFVFGAGARQIAIVGGGILGTIESDASAVNTSFFNFNGSKVSIDGYRLTQVQASCATRMDLFNLQSDAKVSFAGLLPTTNFRALVTHATNFSALGVDDGASKTTHTKSQTPVTSGTAQFASSVLKGGTNALLGVPTDNATKGLSANGNELVNTYTLSTVARNILTVSNTTGNYNVTIKLDCIAETFTSSTTIKGLILFVNGAGGALTQAVELGGSHTLVAAWSGATLQLSVGGGADKGSVQVRVLARESSGSPLIAWAT